ncbi:MULTISPECIES: L,D-transpeptidase, partial [unclassified Picosynechococcus]|uniref:L,D-transpeptidase n=1 Tax=unclassified Picosynechococcus TaxID=3079910 RepID=UPI0004AA7F4C
MLHTQFHQSTLSLFIGFIAVGNVLSLPQLAIAQDVQPSEVSLNDLLLSSVKTPLPPLGSPTTYLPSINQPVRLHLRLGERKVYVYQGDQLKASFPVAIGKAGWETPTGEFSVMQMIKNPAWEHPWNGSIIPPGKDNPLGERWIGFWTDGTNFIGFHGTPDESVMGQAVSHGCVRMRNADIKQLFELVSLETAVVVQP